MGFDYIMNLYNDALKAQKSKQDLKIIESRIGWIISVATSMMNLSYAPVPAEESLGLMHEGHLSLKIIQCLKLTNDLQREGTHKIFEELELILLAFCTAFR